MRERTSATDVQELLDRMRGRSTKDGGTEYVHEYRVEFATRPYSVASVFYASVAGGLAVPLIGAAHPDDLYARVVSVVPKQVRDSDRIFEAVVTYSTKGEDEPEEPPNPLDRPPEWSFEFQGLEVEMV